jgi:pimeloyl-ACP methyl ester carboxylesterase
MQARAGEIETTEFGTGDDLPIALLHEGLGSVAMWRDFPSRLAAATGRRVIAWSRQGYGASAPFERPYHFDFMHREADAGVHLLRARGIDRAHLFGHSDGASIALLMAARHPGMAASLVLEAPHVFVEAMCVEQISKFGKVAEANGVIDRLGKYHRDASAVFRQWHDIWVDCRFADWSIEADMARLDVPALLIQGEDDEYGTFAQLDRISHQLPDTREARLANCGHSPHRDQEEAVLAATAEFLAEIGNG